MVIKVTVFGGEQPLPAYGCCDLGPIILPKFVLNPFTDEAIFDYELFRKSVAIQVRFLDNVLDATMWPLIEQKTEAANKRRIGIGFTGLANALAMLNLSYNSPEGIAKAIEISMVMRNEAYLASVDLAKEKGSFLLFDADQYLQEGTFASRLPESTKQYIRTYGIRNSHLLSIAPTGTVSLAFADNASNGIEPPYSLAYMRKKRMGDGTTQDYPVVDHGLRVYLNTLDPLFAEILLDAICNYRDKFIVGLNEYKVNDVLPKTLVTALSLTTSEHLAMMEAVQPYIDSSISKTVNVPVDCNFDDFKKIYDTAYSSKLKGVSTYRPNGIIGSVLSLGTEVKPAKNETEDNSLNTFIKKRPDGTLDSKTKKVVYTSNFIEDSFYVGVSFTKEIKRPIEVFFTVCPEGVSQEWLDAYAISMSLLARGGLDLFCKALRANRKVKSDKGQIRYGWYTKSDGNKVPKFHSSEVSCMAFAIQEILIEEGIINSEGFPIDSKALIIPKEEIKEVETSKKIDTTNNIIPGKQCKHCGAYAVIKKDSCSYCTNCNETGECGD